MEPSVLNRHGPILICKQGVVGSSPIVSTSPAISGPGLELHSPAHGNVAAGR